MIALLAAMKREVSGPKRHIAIRDSLNGEGYQVFRGEYGGKEVLLVQTGVGREKAERAAMFVLEHYPVSTLVSFGFAGALTVESRIGDIILCSTLHCNDRESKMPCHSDTGLVSESLRLLSGGVTRLRQGTSVSVALPVCEPEAKHALGRTFQADIVDMESGWLARLAGERQIPFLAVRVISDTMQEKMPPFDRIFGGRGWRWAKAIPYFLAHPGDFWLLVRLRRKMRGAGKTMTAFLDKLVEQL
ncbi:MAG: hypothetical protein Q7R57_07025 [Dehalococcoidales bacterium]|nr:hypothetical protein [Dehalococcoidales bacterium]